MIHGLSLFSTRLESTRRFKVKDFAKTDTWAIRELRHGLAAHDERQLERTAKHYLIRTACVLSKRRTCPDRGEILAFWIDNLLSVELNAALFD